MSFAVRFSPEIQAGHIVQALIMLVGVGGWAISGYVTIQGQFQRQDSEIVLVKQRLDQDEKSSAQDRDDNKTFQASVTKALEKISDQLGDVRTLVAKGNARP